MKIAATVILCAALLLLAAMFRYEYSATKNIRIDRFTGKREVLCSHQTDVGWGTPEECTALRTKKASVGLFDDIK